MPPPGTIKTHSTAAFSEKYITLEAELQALMAPGQGKFFIVRVEHMFRLIRLPVPPMRSTNHSFIFLTEGEAIMSIGSETYTIQRHGCLFVPAGSVFSFDHPDVNRGFICHFSDEFFLGRRYQPQVLQQFDFLQPGGRHAIRLQGGQATFVHRLLARLLQLYGAHGLENPELLQAVLMAVLAEVALAEPSEPAVASVGATALAAGFRRLLAADFRSEQTVAGYAARLHVTPNHLNKALRAATGKSPARWIDEHIVLEAKVLLHQTTLPVSEIAAAVGLSDPSYFSRLFKRHTGTSPMAYRKGIEKS